MHEWVSVLYLRKGNTICKLFLPLLQRVECFAWLVQVSDAVEDSSHIIGFPTLYRKYCKPLREGAQIYSLLCLPADQYPLQMTTSYDHHLEHWSNDERCHSEFCKVIRFNLYPKLFLIIINESQQ